jgi:hypothetical protein
MPRDPLILPDSAQLEQMAAILEVSGQYRVLRRISSQPPMEPCTRSCHRHGSDRPDTPR